MNIYLFDGIVPLFEGEGRESGKVSLPRNLLWLSGRMAECALNDGGYI